MKKLKTLTLLCEAGMMAIQTGKFDSAHSIFITIRDLEPNNAAGNIGLASVALAKNEITDAIALLEPMANSTIENAHEAQKLLLVAMMLNGDKQKAGQLHQNLVNTTRCEPNPEKASEAQEFFA